MERDGYGKVGWELMLRLVEFEDVDLFDVHIGVDHLSNSFASLCLSPFLFSFMIMSYMGVSFPHSVSSCSSLMVIVVGLS